LTIHEACCAKYIITDAANGYPLHDHIFYEQFISTAVQPRGPVAVADLCLVRCLPFATELQYHMKQPTPSPRLPWILKISVALTFFNSWVIFEETVIDRHGLWRYMPFYHVGLFCTWDVLALSLIAPAVLFGIAPPLSAFSTASTERNLIVLMHRLSSSADEGAVGCSIFKEWIPM
jgi:hypothetical protein